jgi:hypothetical protein
MVKGQVGYEGPAGGSLTGADKTGIFEVSEGFPNGHPADLEFLGQIALGRQTLAGLKMAQQNGLFELYENLVGNSDRANWFESGHGLSFLPLRTLRNL